MRSIARVWVLAQKTKGRIKMILFRSLFRKVGRNFVFFADDIFSWSTISIGDDVYIGPGAHFSSLKGLEIGDRVMFGPNVTILGGNHNSELNGKAMRFNHTKRETDDEPVCIECDAWIGAGATILKGVTIGRGAIVGAQSVVTKDVRPYEIVAGCPARVVKTRGSVDEINKHESELYPKEEQLNEAQLAHLVESTEQ